MWVTAHATCGAAIASRTNNPLLVAGAALAFHLVLDWVPHWDYPEVPAYAAIDVATAIILVALLTSADGLTWWGAFWAAAPDLEVGLVVLGLMSRTYFPSHRPWFPHGSMSFPAGALIQLAFIGFFLWAVRRRRRR